MDAWCLALNIKKLIPVITFGILGISLFFVFAQLVVITQLLPEHHDGYLPNHPFVVLSAFGYHEERQKQEMLHHTGLYTQNMEYVIFPRTDTQYHLQIVIDNNQYENSTIKVGYGINRVEKIPHRLVPEHPAEYPYFESIQQLSNMKNSTEFHTEGLDRPIIVNFTINFEQPGIHQYLYFEQGMGPDMGGGSSGGGYMVVAEYSRAIDDNGMCKNSELQPLPKHDFSKLVCVTPHGHHELITRGWAPLPG